MVLSPSLTQQQTQLGRSNTTFPTAPRPDFRCLSRVRRCDETRSQFWAVRHETAQAVPSLPNLKLVPASLHSGHYLVVVFVIVSLLRCR